MTETAQAQQQTPSVFGREWARLRADFWDLGMLSWIPVLLCGILWLIFSAGIARDLPIAVIDKDNSTLSRQLTRWLDASPGIQVHEQVQASDQALQLLRERTVFGYLVIPDDFEKQLLGGRQATVQWLYNAQFSSHAGALSRDVRTVTTTLSAGIEMTARAKQGMSTIQAAAQFEPVRTQLNSLYNENISYEAFLTLALMPSMLQIFIVIAVVTAIGRELRDGTVPLWLASAQGSWLRAVAAKLLFPLIAYSALALLYLLFFSLVRDWAVAGSLVGLLLSMLLLVLAYCGLALLLIAATLSLRLSLSGAAFITAPAFAFAGQAFPLMAMPPLARGWAEALPLTHYLQLQTKYWLAGAPWSYGLKEMLILAAFAIVCGALGLFFLSRRANAPAAWGRT
ncbi:MULTISPECIES: ABC transporter permease [unclassified Janthinobacterium]|uniref:ABC transporter permease n=1 Tax=unclassified Janthinobacterium TaxID=2610881 RepID=UPI001616D0BA|nr:MULTISPECIES: ABC transporter permease [unclassified Janthinobacterium]MBB5368962.1 ABC-2 type transport system permease protein [Janthinobacterium sp. K2C7]MBB5381502.1 ABC-2 type transport system permease protein [Janthinobacterium sp. K2Li3]MBB5387344.1 ABC-2 type transport system permease protein [Janthinobacterium sp. K2E3]